MHPAAATRVRSPASQRPPSFARSLSLSLVLVTPFPLLSPALPTATPPVTNPHFHPSAAVGSCAFRAKSNREHFHPLPTATSNPTLVATGGKLLPLNARAGYDRGEWWFAHIVVVAILAILPPSTLRVLARRFASLYPRELPLLALPTLAPISPPNPALSTYRMLRHSREIYGYFAKWLNALPDYGTEGGSGARHRLNCDIGHRLHRRIPL